MNLSKNIIRNIRYMLAHGHNQILDELYLPNTSLYGTKFILDDDKITTALDDVIYTVRVQDDKRVLEIPGGIYTNDELEYIVKTIQQLQDK